MGTPIRHYRRIPTLREYVVVSHRERSIELRRRDAEGEWSTHLAGPGESLKLESLDAVLDVDSLYDAALGPRRPA